MKNNLILDNLKAINMNFQFRELHESEIENIQYLISLFDSLNNYAAVILSGVVEIAKNQHPSILTLLNFTFIHKGIKSPQNISSFTEYELIGIAILNKDYGRVLIRPETFVDKINDLFISTDIDFNFDEEFSRKYYVVADDETKARKCISKSFLQTIRSYDGLEIEIADNTLMVRLRKPFSPENGETIIHFITAINDGFN